MRTTGYLLLMAMALSCGDETAVITPVHGPLVESVYASGVVKAAGQYEVRSQVSGSVTEVHVQAGDTVDQGQLLFALEGDAAVLEQENARLAYARQQDEWTGAQNRLVQLKEQADVARKAYELDSSRFIRQQRLWAQGIGSRNDFDQRALAMESSRASWKSAKSAYEGLQKDVRTAAGQARVNLDKAGVSRGYYDVRSRRAGKVFRVEPEVGESITPQQVLAVVGAADSFLVELQVDEYDITRVKPGQLVRLTLDSYPGEVYTARIARIDPIMDSRTRTFTAEAVFERRPPRLYPFLSVEANIEISRRERALIIPVNCLVNDSSVVLAGGDTVRVVTGLRDYQKVEVLQGLDSSSRLQIPGAP